MNAAVPFSTRPAPSVTGLKIPAATLPAKKIFHPVSVIHTVPMARAAAATLLVSLSLAVLVFDGAAAAAGAAPISAPLGAGLFRPYPAHCYAGRRAPAGEFEPRVDAFEALSAALVQCGAATDASTVIVQLGPGDHKLLPEDVARIPPRVRFLFLYGAGSGAQPRVLGNFGAGLHPFALAVSNVAFNFGARGDCAMGAYGGVLTLARVLLEGGSCHAVFELGAAVPPTVGALDLTLRNVHAATVLGAADHATLATYYTLDERALPDGDRHVLVRRADAL